MGLIKCPECYKSISNNKGTICPNCGFVLTEPITQEQLKLNSQLRQDEVNKIVHSVRRQIMISYLLVYIGLSMVFCCIVTNNHEGLTRVIGTFLYPFFLLPFYVVFIEFVKILTLKFFTTKYALLFKKMIMLFYKASYVWLILAAVSSLILPVLLR
jgi:hypothetical protein